MSGRRPSGRVVPGRDSTWTWGWPAARISAVGDECAARAVIGECGADEPQFWDALPVVRVNGRRALTRWPGSYLVVARSGGTLIVIGGLAGQHPVYYRTDAAGTWWATAASALAALDVIALAAHLACGQPDVLATGPMAGRSARIWQCRTRPRSRASRHSGGRWPR
ncbi:hypothetical protein ACH4FX_42505 [Streptomyces sp. NPDC018019]|uniref:hypothetical protein n=1 Tax=Streptomyces sp. NPDC018019 TaxID=3365030 RepID=UPI0037AA027F